MGKSLTVRFTTITSLLLVNLFYSTVGIATKYASMQVLFSLRYFIGLASAVLIIGVYAIWWQQIIKNVGISMAYMFRATCVIYVLVYSAFLFGEEISICNIAGAVIIITGIVLFIKSN